MLAINENSIGKTLIDEHNNYVITNIAINNKFKEWCDFNPTMNRLKNILNISENKMSELCNNIQELELFIADNRTHEIKMCKTIIDYHYDYYVAVDKYITLLYAHIIDFKVVNYIFNINIIEIDKNCEGTIKLIETECVKLTR